MPNVYLMLLVAVIVLPISISPYLRRKSFHTSSREPFWIVKDSNYPMKHDLDVPVIDVVYCTMFHNIGHALSVAFTIIVLSVIVGKLIHGTYDVYDLCMIMSVVLLYAYFLIGAKNMLFSQLVITSEYLHFIGPYNFIKWHTVSISDVKDVFYITQGSGILWIKPHYGFPMLFVGVSNGTEICNEILSRRL